jgi:hypothetical protein
MAAYKPEVVITPATNGIGTRFWCLHLCFRGRRNQWSIDRQRFMLARHRIQHGGLQTGSSNNFCYKWHRNAILVSTPMFSRMPKPIEHRPTTNYARMYRIQHGGLKTGSSNNFCYKWHINAILVPTPRSSRTTIPMEHRSTTNYACAILNSTWHPPNRK